MTGQRCPGCGHAPHAGRCRVVVSIPPTSREFDRGGYGRQAHCPCKEEPHGIDRAADSGNPGLPVPGAGVGTLAESLKDLTAALDEPLVIFGGKTTREMLGGGGEGA